MKKFFIAALAAALGTVAGAQNIDVKRAESISPYIFGHNLEHTRSAVTGGLSAQMLSNRKFAGKPSRNQGLAPGWFAIGAKTFYILYVPDSFTSHTCNFGMSRQNELASQLVQNMFFGEESGMGQGGLAVEAGRSYTLRTVTKVSAPLTLKVALTDASGSIVYAERYLPLSPSGDWQEEEFELLPSASDSNASIRYTYTEQAEIRFGALSMLPSDNFYGMRKDVVELFKSIRPRLIRWPGGNFAGEYRWKDGLLPVDRRGPLQAAMEMETQPHSFGYDNHEIGTDEFIALCREVGAQPMITINAAWSTPEESAQWVEYCNGPADSEYGRKRAENGHPEPYDVKFWSLGNEMGYGHMEGPAGPEAYASLVSAQGNAMLEVSPDLELCSSGPYPNDNWAANSAAPMASFARYTSLHHYANTPMDYTTEEDIARTYNNIVGSVSGNVSLARKMRESLNKTGAKLHISFDEWNMWYAWNRPSSVAEGIYCARTMHFYINESNALDIPVVCYFQPIGEGAVIISPTSCELTANGQVFALMSAHQDGRLCHVSENEDYSTAASIKDGVLTVTLINYEYDTARSFHFPIKGKLLEARLLSSEDVRPFTRFSEAPLRVAGGGKSIDTELPPHSVAIIKIKQK